MGEVWEKYGKILQVLKRQISVRYLTDMGELWEKYGKISDRHLTDMGELWENYGRTWENMGEHGKT